MNSTHLKTSRSASWHCPNSAVALRLLENVVIVSVTNREVVKLRVSYSFSSFFSPIAPKRKQYHPG